MHTFGLWARPLSPQSFDVSTTQILSFYLNNAYPWAKVIKQNFLVTPQCQSSLPKVSSSLASAGFGSLTMCSDSCRTVVCPQLIAVNCRECGLIGTKKGMAVHCSTLAWRIPRTEEPGRLQSMGSQIVRHDWATSLSLSQQ